ncbi:hypothetical protein [Bradyrhizobium sp.]|uniref:hypothetical protein n=1 Tax=Bradyrhizobium sp. TaxID=376 RepID=UPI0040381DAD
MRRIANFFISALVAIFSTPLLWYLSLGYYQPAEHWLFDVYSIKEHRARQSASPKLVIASGSNALFGMDSELLERLLGKPVVNMAGHAGLPIDFHAEKALTIAAAGDTVVMPLEFGYYASEPKPTSWEVANLASWGADYAKRDLRRLWTLFRHSTLADSVQRLRLRPIPHDPLAVVLARATENTAGGIAVWQGYSYRSANAWGDFFVREGGPTFEGPAPYTRGQLTPYAIERLSEIRRKFEGQGVTLRLTWPVTAKNREFDLTRPEHRKPVIEIKERLRAAGIEFICEPEYFHFDRHLFLNTNYHLGTEGAVYRTEALAACIQGHKPSAKRAAELYEARLKSVR